jgi:hypothetical protein
MGVRWKRGLVACFNGLVFGSGDIAPRESKQLASMPLDAYGRL